MRLWGGALLQAVSFTFVWIVRSVPPLVLLLFWFQLASLYPTLSLGIPFGPSFVSVDTTHLIGPLVAASVQLIYNQNFSVMPLLLVATIWYIVITSVLAMGQYFVERRFNRGHRDARPFREVLRDAARLRPRLPPIGSRR